MTTPQVWFDAAKSGDIPTLQQALTDGFNINTVDDKLNTALHFATKEKQYETMHFLIKNGADFQMQNDWLSKIGRASCRERVCL